MRTLVRAIAALGLVFVAWLLGGSRSRSEAVRAPIVRLVVKHPWLTFAALAAGAMIVAGVVVVSGIVPIKASSGHWRITALFLDFAKTRSVATHSWTIQPPPAGTLDSEAQVLRGAAHYETACVPCHGGPGRSIPPVMAAMTPPPPELTGRIARWTAEELFSIVRHGIKLTGMPGWPVQRRDDEVWAMVAFLRRLPALDAAGYHRLVFGAADSVEPSLPRSGDAAPPRSVQRMCWRCHGVDGTGRGEGAFPNLAGQKPEYLYGSLRAFQSGTRFSGIMGEIASRLDDRAMREIAAYYSALPARAADGDMSQPASARGRTLAVHGLPDREIPPCAECHGPAPAPKNPAYPVLAGQDPSYLASQLRLLQARSRGGTAHVDLMHVFVDRLREDEIREVARYYASLRATDSVHHARAR